MTNKPPAQLATQIKALLALSDDILVFRGGRGSGNFGHKGRKGKRGGSGGSSGRGGGKSLSEEDKKQRDEIVSMIMESKDKDTWKPTFLVHNIGGAFSDQESVKGVKKNGLEANFSDWQDVSEFIPHRPKGNFLWGEDKEQKGNSSQVRVEVSDIDKNKLWAFPSMAAFAADELSKGGEGIPMLKEALNEIKPVKYDDYNSEFHAEWIYTDDIDAKLLKDNP